MGKAARLRARSFRRRHLCAGAWGLVGLQALSVAPESGLTALALATLALAGLLVLDRRQIQALAFSVAALFVAVLHGMGGPSGILEAPLLGLVAAVAATPASPPIRQPGPAPSRRLKVRTLGEFQVSLEGEDLTGVLIRKPSLALLWIFLLLWALRHPEDAVSRARLADEASPGLSRSEQARRLTSQLWDLRHDLPPALVGPVRVERDRVLLAADELDLDALHLLRLRDEARGEGQVVSDRFLAEAVDALDSAWGVSFLRGMEDRLEAGAGSRGSALDLLREVRGTVHEAGLELAVRLARALIARGSTEAAVAILERALAWEETPGDVAELLVRAYLGQGRWAAAASLEKRIS